MTDLHTRLSSDERMEQFAAATAMKRNGTPDECASAVRDVYPGATIASV